MNRRATALRLGNHLHDLRQQSFRTNSFCFHYKRAGPVYCGAHDPIAGFLFDLNRFAGDHRFIDRARAFRNHAVHRNLLAGTNPQTIALFDLIESNVVLAAVLCNSPRCFWRQAQQRFNRRAGRAARFQFEHLTEQDQRGDYGCGFEIDRHISRRVMKRRRKNLRYERGNHAVNVSHSYAEADQREHVEAAIQNRLPTAHEERPTTPEYHGRSQGE